jgi:hypothetical protein
VILGIFLAVAILTLIVLKFMLAIAFAVLDVGGPALIGFSAFPRVGRLPLAILTRGLATVTLVPFAWTVVFVAWAGVSAGTFDTVTGKGSGIVNALMGPGLFLAAIVMLLAVTKKTLAMATFGMPLKIPGAGLARMATRTLVGLGVAGGVGAAKGAVTAAGVGGSGATREAVAAAQLRAGPNDAKPQAGGGQASTGGQPSKGQRRRGLEPVGPNQQRLEQNQAREEKGRLASQAFGAVVSEGYWGRGREPSPKEGQAARGRIDDLRARGGPSDDQLTEAKDKIPVANRSAMESSAKSARRENPGNPEQAYRQFRDDTVKHTAGVDGSPQTREAIELYTAAGPERTQKVFQGAHARFSWGDSGAKAMTPNEFALSGLMGSGEGQKAPEPARKSDDEGDLVF